MHMFPRVSTPVMSLPLLQATTLVQGTRLNSLKSFPLPDTSRNLRDNCSRPNKYANKRRPTPDPNLEDLNQLHTKWSEGEGKCMFQTHLSLSCHFLFSDKFIHLMLTL